MLATGSWVPNPAGRPSEQSKTGNGGQQPFPHDALREVLGQRGHWGDYGTNGGNTQVSDPITRVQNIGHVMFQCKFRVNFK